MHEGLAEVGSRHLGESSWRSAAVQGLSFTFLPCKVQAAGITSQRPSSHMYAELGASNRLGRDDLQVQAHKSPLHI